MLCYAVLRLAVWPGRYYKVLGCPFQIYVRQGRSWRNFKVAYIDATGSTIVRAESDDGEKGSFRWGPSSD